ncbi:MAG TPA: response regulator [Alphaproteobacteria bacterium]|nr:response regulator [Alphaproteobacteria bacterium]
MTLDRVRVAHFDPNMRMRTLLRGMLLTTGFREIRECRSLDNIISLLETDAIDLLLIDIDTDTDEICKIVREIREGRLGPDPYVVIMALTWKPEQDMISRALQTGTDDLIAKPISTKVLAERTANLIYNRRDFVVTTSYIGPDRREPERRKPGDLPAIKVPNSLRFKATGDAAAVADVGALTAARETVKSHRVVRISAEISDKALVLEAGITGNTRAKISSADLKELVRKVTEINRLIETEELTQLATIGHSMTHVVNSIVDVGQASKRLLALLRLHSQAIAATVKGDKAAAELVTNALGRAVEVVQAVGKETPKPAAA